MVDTTTSTLTRSPYDILKVNRWDDDETIKAQYFHLVKQFNPEYFPDEFIEIRTAYDILKEPNTRATSDVENFCPPPHFKSVHYPSFPGQPLSLFKLNQEMKALCGEGRPEHLEGEDRDRAVKILNGVGLYQIVHGHQDEASAAWNQILVLAPDDEDAKRNLYYAYWAQGIEKAKEEEYAEAEKIFSELIEKEFVHAVIYQNIALSQEFQGKKAESAEAWKQCLDSYNQELNENPNDLYLKALVLSVHKFTGGKFLQDSRIIDTNGESFAGSAKELGYACVQQGNWSQAVEALGRALAEEPDDVDVLCQLGWGYLNTNQHHKAFHMWNSALKKASGKRQVLDHLVRGYSIFGKMLRDQRIFNQALVQFKNALKHEPNNVELRTLLAETYFDMRNFTSAAREYERIMEIEPRNKAARQGIRESKRLGGLR